MQCTSRPSRLRFVRLLSWRCSFILTFHHLQRFLLSWTLYFLCRHLHHHPDHLSLLSLCFKYLFLFRWHTRSFDQAHPTDSISSSSFDTPAFSSASRHLSVPAISFAVFPLQIIVTAFVPTTEERLAFQSLRLPWLHFLFLFFAIN